MSNARSDHAELEISDSAGQGVFAGCLTALSSHWIGGVNLLTEAVVYGFFLAHLRGWPELAAILTMIGTTVVYSAVYDVIALEPVDQGWKIALIILALGVFAGYVAAVWTLVNHARIRALQDSEALAHDVARSQHWEERYFARLRAAWVADRSVIPPFIWPLAWSAAAIVIFFCSLGRFVDSLAWGVVFFHAIVLSRMVRYVQRLQQPRGETVIAQAVRRLILFLRPFALDALPVSPFGDKGNEAFNPLAWLDKRTFEEHLAATFEDLGAVIAIGRPGEEIAPLGAARLYADDATWQALVRERAANAEFVIIEVDATPGVVWEIDEVSRLVGLQRMLVILPPGEDIHRERSAEWYERWAALRERFGFLPQVSKQTAAVLYDRNDQPILINGHKSSVLKSLQAIKTAWLQARA